MFNVELEAFQVNQIVSQALKQKLESIENKTVTAETVSKYDAVSETLSMFMSTDELEDMSTRDVPTNFTQGVLELSA